VKSLFYIVVGVILFLAFSPSQFTPSIVGGHDKIAHFVAFFVLSFGMKISFTTYSFRRIFLMMALLAAGIEIFQYGFTSRQFSIADFGAGMAGVFIYLSMVRIITKGYSIFGQAYNASVAFFGKNN
jgi:VanZ family protein